jgi:hypothetical protein
MQRSCRNMPTLKVAIDVHDTARVRQLTAVNHERPRGRGRQVARDKTHIGAGPLIVRLAYHAELFQRKILRQVELPPVAGPRHMFCLAVTTKEREMIRRLAAARGWTMTDLVRALIFHHWRIREEYRLSAPQLTEMARVGFHECLSFQPDRLQPWYYHAGEVAERIEARSLEDQNNLVATLRHHKIDEKVIAHILEDFAEARHFRAKYAWDEDDVSPAELRHREYQSDGGL